ncbi:uncharacterized protein DUF222 [Haloactinopolyspora alba]|uniref:Uncharacterized protein DUF222 n=1 Tax=Haloactinopolyspora alba TaxID=648780 RepID=A0A2P8EGC7_9ACTN|nr:DUF222 domain-containing protein [Haloactinopolyspora alba]PSL08517.1 uncharacterized protein DUF222 [Haloactinopolyspora alba]
MMTPGVAAVEWESCGPGAELAVALEGVDVPGAEDGPLVDVIVAAERQVAHLRALQMRAMAELSERENYAFCGGCDDAWEASPEHAHDRVRAVGSEVSAALSCTPAQADTRAGLAVELAEDLPATLAALESGRIDERRAGLIASKTRVLGHFAQREVEADVLPTAGERTSRQLAAALDRRVLRADPGAAERRRQRGRAERRVEAPRPTGAADGMAEMVLTGPAEDLTALHAAIDAAARAARAARAEGDERALQQLRFDILAGLGWTALQLGHLGCCHPDCTTTSTTHTTDATDDAATDDAATDDAATGDAVADVAGSTTHSATGAAGASGATGGPVADTAGAADADTVDGGVAGAGPVADPVATTAAAGARAGPYRLATRHGRGATVNVTLAYTTLVGVDEEPAHLDGYGPITADTARAIAADATLRRLLTDPVDGRLLEYGRSTYTPPRALADFIIARDRTCRFPTADTPASICDIDHRQPYQRGGTTGASNNQALSRRFHLDKTLHGWDRHQLPNGALRWTSPAGRTYTVHPEPIGHTHNPPPDAAEHDPPPF